MAPPAPVIASQPPPVTFNPYQQPAAQAALGPPPMGPNASTPPAMRAPPTAVSTGNDFPISILPISFCVFQDHLMDLPHQLLLSAMVLRLLLEHLVVLLILLFLLLLLLVLLWKSMVPIWKAEMPPRLLPPLWARCRSITPSVFILNKPIQVTRSET